MVKIIVNFFYIMKSIYIFHRSIRLDDNKGLLEALKNSDHVIPVFIFTPEQITEKNKFRSLYCLSFMINALIDLDKTLRKYKSKLYIFYGKQEEVISDILDADQDITRVYINKDYTDYAVKREEKIKKVVEKRNLSLFSIEDYLLHNMGTIVTGKKEYYSVFTPFYRAGIKHNVDKVIKNNRDNYISSRYKIKNEVSFDKIIKIIDLDLDLGQEDFPATRQDALKRLNAIKDHKNYGRDRNNLTQETTKLSPYIKFGLLSIREVYHKIYSLFGRNHDLIKQLYWREFYYNISYNRPDLFNESASFRESYDKIKWNDDNKLYNKWMKGITGYPIVDAGMRELNNTGYMHNRSRLITSNFLVKHLFIDWRLGEKYYASKLIDYDPSVNNGNWQFSSGSGADSQPYFRMMNPWLQGERHDPDCEYIKKWVPELSDLPPEVIHNWNEEYVNYKGIYHPPCKIYDFAKLKKESKRIYSKAF